MLLRLQNYSLKLEQPQVKVLKVCLAAKNTYIMVVCSDDTCDEKLVHVDSAGKCLW